MKCSSCCSHVSRLQSLVFLWLRRVYGGSCKTFPFRSPTLKICGSVARNVRFDAPTCLVSSLWFPVASPCLWRKLQNLSFLEVSKQVVMSFCMAGVALCDIPQPVLYRAESVKIGGSVARNVRFDAPTCLVSSLWFSCGLAVFIGEAAKPLLFESFQAGCHVVLRGRHGTL